MNSNDWPPKLLLFSMQRFIGRLAPKRDTPCNVLQPATIVPALKWIYFLQPSIPPKCCSLRLASEKSFLTATFVRSHVQARSPRASRFILVQPSCVEISDCSASRIFPSPFHFIKWTRPRTVTAACKMAVFSFLKWLFTSMMHIKNWKLVNLNVQCTQKMLSRQKFNFFGPWS